MLELLLSELCCYRTFIRVTTSDQSEWSIQERCDVSSDENRDDPPTETSFFKVGIFSHLLNFLEDIELQKCACRLLGMFLLDF